LTVFDIYQSQAFDIRVPQQTPTFFEFRGLQFYPDQALIVRLSDGSRSFIRPKEEQLLTTLLSRPGDTVTYKELWDLLWPEIPDFGAARRTMTETRSTLDKLLRKILKTEISIIQTITNVGYRIQGPVARKPKAELPIAEPNEMPTADAAPRVSSATTTISQVVPSVFKAHQWHLLGSCALYSLAYVCVLFLEVAYSSDQFWPRALRLSPLIFLWVFVTSLVSLFIDWRLTLKRGANTLPFAILSFIGSALILYGALVFFLPQIPITQATFQTQTAQAAFLKNMALYFLPLVVVFVVIPFHFIASLNHEIAVHNVVDVSEVFLGKPKGPRNAIYLKPRTLGVLLVVAAIVSLPSTYWLLDHLKASPYMNRFMLLVICREILYFGLGAECLLWYSRTLNDIKDSLS
jgi:DNA-binding winged helix-turn-helix (wHTH) protein